MVKKISSSGDKLAGLVDIYTAVKRGLLHKGLIRQENQDQSQSQSKSGNSKVNSKSTAQGQKQSASADSTSQKGLTPTEDKEKLQDMASQAHEILYKANTVFPFTLFPDTVTLDREKVSIAQRFFFSVAKVTSVPVRDILSVEADVGPFFGSLKTASRYFITNPYTVNYLWRKDTEELRTLLQGYIIAYEQEIDCSSIKKDELIKLLKKLGSGDTD